LLQVSSIRKEKIIIARIVLFLATTFSTILSEKHEFKTFACHKANIWFGNKLKNSLGNLSRNYFMVLLCDLKTFIFPP